MKTQANPDRLSVASNYSVHVVEKDAVVVLYNRSQPLILQGKDKVRLFDYILSLPNSQLTLESLMSLSEELLQLVARLLRARILQPAV